MNKHVTFTLYIISFMIIFTALYPKNNLMKNTMLTYNSTYQADQSDDLIHDIKEKHNYIQICCTQVGIPCDDTNYEGFITLLTERIESQDTIKEIITQAHIYAQQDHAVQFHIKYCIQAFMTYLYGPKHETDALKVPLDRASIAYHEAAHAILTLSLDTGRTMKWVSIQSYNQIGGHVFSMQCTPNSSREQKLNDIAQFLSGHISQHYYEQTQNQYQANLDTKFENYVHALHEIHDDIYKAQKIAYDIAHGDALQDQDQQLTLLCNSLDEHEELTEELFDNLYEKATTLCCSQEKIKAKACQILQEQFERTQQLVRTYQPYINCIAEKLVQEEALSRDQIIQIINEIKS